MPLCGGRSSAVVEPGESAGAAAELRAQLAVERDRAAALEARLAASESAAAASTERQAALERELERSLAAAQEARREVESERARVDKLVVALSNGRAVADAAHAAQPTAAAVAPREAAAAVARGGASAVTPVEPTAVRGTVRVEGDVVIEDLAATDEPALDWRRQRMGADALDGGGGNTAAQRAAAAPASAAASLGTEGSVGAVAAAASAAVEHADATPSAPRERAGEDWAAAEAPVPPPTAAPQPPTAAMLTAAMLTPASDARAAAALSAEAAAGGAAGAGGAPPRGGVAIGAEPVAPPAPAGATAGAADAAADSEAVAEAAATAGEGRGGPALGAGRGGEGGDGADPADATAAPGLSRTAPHAPAAAEAADAPSAEHGPGGAAPSARPPPPPPPPGAPRAAARPVPPDTPGGGAAAAGAGETGTAGTAVPTGADGGAALDADDEESQMLAALAAVVASAAPRAAPAPTAAAAVELSAAAAPALPQPRARGAADAVEGEWAHISHRAAELAEQLRFGGPGGRAPPAGPDFSAAPFPELFDGLPPGRPLRFVIAHAEERAISLRQLRHLVYVASARCEAEGWTSTAPGQPRTRLRHESFTMYDLMHYFILPATVAHGCSVVELLATAPQRPDWVVSHAWGGRVSELLGCLAQHARDRGLDEESTAYWLCATGANQQELELGLGATPTAGSAFMAAMRGAAGTVSVLDADGLALGRQWCAFEAYAALTELLRSRAGGGGAAGGAAGGGAAGGGDGGGGSRRGSLAGAEPEGADGLEPRHHLHDVYAPLPPEVAADIAKRSRSPSAARARAQGAAAGGAERLAVGLLDGGAVVPVPVRRAPSSRSAGVSRAYNAVLAADAAPPTHAAESADTRAARESFFPEALALRALDVRFADTRASRRDDERDIWRAVGGGQGALLVEATLGARLCVHRLPSLLPFASGPRHAELVRTLAALRTSQLRSVYIGLPGDEHGRHPTSGGASRGALSVEPPHAGAVDAVLDALPPSLTRLEVHHWTEKQFGFSLAERLQRGALPALRSLTLRACADLVDEGWAEALGRALRRNQGLRTLDLRANLLEDSLAIWVSAALRENRSITAVDLSNTEMGDAGALALADALKHNSVLARLALGENQLSRKAREKLRSAWKDSAGGARDPACLTV